MTFGWIVCGLGLLSGIAVAGGAETVHDGIRDVTVKVRVNGTGTTSCGCPAPGRTGAESSAMGDWISDKAGMETRSSYRRRIRRTREAVPRRREGVANRRESVKKPCLTPWLL
jgi:hypothetical protein